MRTHFFPGKKQEEKSRFSTSRVCGDDNSIHFMVFNHCFGRSWKKTMRGILLWCHSHRDSCRIHSTAVDTCSFASFNRHGQGVCCSYISCWLNHLSTEEHPLQVMLLQLGTGIPAPGMWELWLLLHTEFLHHVIDLQPLKESSWAALADKSSYRQWRTNTQKNEALPLDEAVSLHVLLTVSRSWTLFTFNAEESAVATSKLGTI